MKLGFVFDTKFIEFENNYYSVSLSAKMLKKRYMSVFDELVIIGRVKHVEQSPEGKMVKSNGDGIEFRCIEDMSSFKRALCFRKQSVAIKTALKDCDAVICRGWRGTYICRQLGKPYLVEVVNCAWDSYWNHGFLGKLVAPIMFGLRRVSTKKAPYVQYVTNEFLQKRYPTDGKLIGVSDVALDTIIDEDILNRRLEKIEEKQVGAKIIIGTAGAVNVPFKGQRFVIKALAILKKQGITNFEYQLAGGGSNEKLKRLAEQLGVSDQVVFKGSIIHDDIFEWYDSLDLYVQPSLQEGLPRAMIEAMSRGLPCYGTNTGGIPELIDSSCICNRKSNLSKEFAKFFSSYNKTTAIKLASENYNESKNYDTAILDERWLDFLEEFSQAIGER